MPRRGRFHDEAGENPEELRTTLMKPRAYQQELLEESMQHNLIIALDTGSGKTHIAVLRMKHESERDSKKVSWFLAPTVALVEQQRDVISKAIPVSVGKISGASEPNQWKDPALWRGILESHKIVVTTPQVLLDALHHGYIDMGKDISLIVFDEAHHAVDKHPYNLIMKVFYFDLPPRTEDASVDDRVRPMILGLTASPTYGTNVHNSFRILEGNLDCIIRSTRLNREELATYVHRPTLKVIRFWAPPYDPVQLPSVNCAALERVVKALNVENDPYVKSLRKQLAKLQLGDERRRLDQKLSKTIHKEDTFTHTGLRDFLRAAQDICMDLGPWAADWYIQKVIEQAKYAANPYNNMMMSWKESEKVYLLNILSQVHVVPASSALPDILAGISPKMQALIQCLKMEEAETKNLGETFSGIIFVTRRDAVIALTELLCRFPDLTELFNMGSLLGSSNSAKRHAFLDITRTMLRDSQQDTLHDFRTGEKNLIISTSVAEEGIDIQACGCVIRWDPPPNVVAWAQSRGRARRKRSTFAIMFQEGGGQEQLIHKWMQAESQMISLYNNIHRQQTALYDIGESEDYVEEEEVTFETAAGARLSLHSATSHLNHFCVVFTAQGRQIPVYELDPPEFPEGWHSFENRGFDTSPGPWTATVHLPRALPKHLRSFTTKKPYNNKRSARRHAAFEAYVKLYEEGLLNENLLPLMDDLRPDKGEVAELLKDVEKREGLTSVELQMNPWACANDTNVEVWYTSELRIDNMPLLHMFTRSQLPEISQDAMPLLYIPGQKPVHVHIQSKDDRPVDVEVLERAREYTFNLFNILYSTHMDPKNKDFAYLFLPEGEDPHQAALDERKEWMRQRCAAETTIIFENVLCANAEILARKFSYPTDFALVRANDKYGKVLRFDKWQTENIDAEEEEEVKERYKDFPDFKLTYPLLQVRRFHRRANFLVPLSSESDALSYEEPFLIHPKYATVQLISATDVRFSMLLPSILHWLTNTLTIISLRDNLFKGTPMTEVPLSLLATATTSGVAQEAFNYQRLETLGDTVLKFLVSMQLFTDFPLWHEGYLARRKDHTVSNSRLAREAIGKGLYQWIIRERFVPRKWRPRYLTSNGAPDSKVTEDVVEVKVGPETRPEPEGQNEPGKDEIAQVAHDQQQTAQVAEDGVQEMVVESTPTDEKKKKKKKKKQEMSTKVLADVVEALIGAAFVHGGFDLAVDCAKTFKLGLEHWETIPVRVETVLSRIEEVENPPPQLKFVELMLGHEFKHKALLIQALTHASYQGELDTISYERMEFLGDCVLDIIVTDYLYNAPGRNYKPGHIHMRKESLVNSHFLAFICMSTSISLDATMPNWNETEGLSVKTEANEIHLYQCLLHSSHRVLEDEHLTFTRFQRNREAIKKALERDHVYPYASLTKLQAPKFLSDMVESLLGAVYLDSGGDWEVVRSVLRKLGILPIMERFVRDDVDVLHPVSRLAIWAAQQDPQLTVRYETEKVDGNVSCAVLIDDEEVIKLTEVYRSRATENEIRLGAAEQALNILQVLQEEEAEEEEDGWGDVPEYGW